ncbi:RHS repeat-associated core domain-containing protein [Planctomycetota bacterium]|nr:RHS repeat-associated core domain-containing protein [Planctomycetota bacterium]
MRDVTVTIGGAIETAEFSFGQDENYNVYTLFNLDTDLVTLKAVEHYRYDAYGRFTAYDGTGVELGTASSGYKPLSAYLYQGRRWDVETGLYQYRARYMNPRTGRFISHDPLGYIDGMNLYEFVGSSPLSLLDPMGTKACSSALADFAGGLLGGVVETLTFGFVDSKRIGNALGVNTDSRAFQAGSITGMIVGEVGLILATGGAGTIRTIARGVQHVGDASSFARDVYVGGIAVAIVGTATIVGGRAIGRAKNGVPDAQVGDKVTRHWGGKSGPHGESWTRDSMSGQTRESLGLDRSNTAEFVSHGTVTSTKGVTTKKADAWGGFGGGGDEVVIPDPLQQVQLDAVTMPDTPLPDGR